MLKTTKASNGLVFASFLYRKDLFSAEDFLKLFNQHFGEAFQLIPKHNPLNAYYSQEMQSHDLGRIFFLSTQTLPRETLLEAKLLALNWENQWAQNEKRMVNVDVGFLSQENFLLATTKNYSHRVYLGSDIFADLTYYFHMGKLQTLPWTYPDYEDEEKMEFMTWARSFLLQKNRAEC